MILPGHNGTDLPAVRLSFLCSYLKGPYCHYVCVPLSRHALVLAK